MHKGYIKGIYRVYYELLYAPPPREEVGIMNENPSPGDCMTLTQEIDTDTGTDTGT